MAMNISALPEGCLSHILSLTSPVDVLRSSAVSKQFLSASDSDAVWGAFLPSDYNEIISHSSTPLQFGSIKDLVLHLCTSYILLENDSKSFALDKWSAKKCYMLGARALSIAWGDTPIYWKWTSIPESRFKEVAKLEHVCWLEIKGKVHANLLSSNTSYGIYFVFKMAEYQYGFKNLPVKAYVTEVDEEYGLSMDHHHSTVIKTFTLTEEESGQDMYLRYETVQSDSPVVERVDGWMEIEMGRYRVEPDGANERVVLEMVLKEIEMGNSKKGLIVHGIELRPFD